jgi:hypothetical protein
MSCGQDAFAFRLLAEQNVVPQEFALHCVSADDAVALRFMLCFCFAYPLADEGDLVRWAAIFGRRRCLRVLLELDAPWDPINMTHLAGNNCLDTLEVFLDARKDAPWCPVVPTIAANLGNVRFLRMIADAGCPLWTSASDRGTCLTAPERTLVVSSDILSSGPVLLFAAEKGCPLTPRMKSTLREVRRRALALACCFHKATRLSRGPGKAALRWAAMGKVPRELVERIATLARISIAAHDLVK